MENEEERKRFESWCRRGKINSARLDKQYPGYPVGTYEDSRTDAAWKGWLAALSEPKPNNGE